MRLWLVLVMASGVAAARERRCAVEGKQVEPFVVDVQPKAAAPFKLQVSGVPVTAYVEPEDSPAHVEVHGALGFSATVPADKLPWKTARTVDAMSGMVRLAPATSLVLHATAFPRVVQAEVPLGPVRIRNLMLPCSGLTLDAVAAPAPRLVPTSGASLVAAVNELRFRAGPGSGPELLVSLGDDPTLLDLHRVETHGEWVRVSSRWADGTILVGWVKRDALKPAGPRHEPLGDLPIVPAGCKREPTARPGERSARARVTIGTQVYAARYLGAWGTVQSTGPFEVRWLPKDDWVSIVVVPGIASTGDCLSSGIEEAWVPRQSVALPREENPDGGS